MVKLMIKAKFLIDFGLFIKSALKFTKFGPG